MAVRARGLLPWVALGVVVGLGIASWPFTVDDAFVLGRYARRIAQGAGYTMNDGPPTDGVTGPLALVPALAGEALFGDPVGASKAAGLLAAAIAAALAVRAAARRSAGEGAVALLLSSGGATLAVWGAAGLETGLATLALTAAGLAVLARLEGAAEDRPGGWGSDAAPGERRAEAQRRPETGSACRSGGPRRSAARATARASTLGVLAGGAVGALAWLRPELALASGVLLLALFRHDRRAGALALALAGLGLVSVVAFRLALFDAPLPLSAQAKPPDLGNGAEYTLRGILIALGAGGLYAAWLGASEGGGGRRVLFAMLVAHLAALVLAGGDWMPGFRLFAPVLPLYALLAAGPIASRLARPGRRLRGAALLCACAVVPLADAAVQLPAVRAAGATREQAGAELADWLGAHARRVAMVDVGYVALRSGVEIVDLGGITDPRIGALPGGHLDKQIDPGMLRALAPDTIVLHASAPPEVDSEGRLRSLAGYPVERRVARMPWVRAELRVVRVVSYAPGYYYVVLAARSPRAGIGGRLEAWPLSSRLASSSPHPRSARRASRAP